MMRFADFFKEHSMRISSRFNDWIDHTKLPNGLEIASQWRLAALDKKLRFHVCIKTGSYEDPQGKEGLAHHTEHLLINPSQHALIKQRGGYINAGTSAEQMAVYGYVDDSPDNAKFIAGILSKILQGDIDESDFIRQKTAILNEKLNDDDSARAVHSGLLRKAFRGERSHYHVLGFDETIEKLTPNDLRNFKKAWFLGSNITVGITGASHNALHSLLDRELKSIPSGPTLDRLSPEFVSVDYRENNGHTQQFYFGFDFPAPPVDLKKAAIAAVADTYLQNALHKRIRDELGIVYGIGLHINVEKSKTGYMQVNGSMLPRHADQIAPEVANILAEASVAVNAEEFEKARKEALDNLDFRKLPVPFIPQNAEHMANSLAYENRIVSLQEEERLYKEVTPEQVADFIASIVSRKPAIIAYGDHSKLHSYDDFVAMLEKRREALRAQRESAPALAPARS